VAGLLADAVGVRVVVFDGGRREVGARLAVSFRPEDGVLLPAEPGARYSPSDGRQV
jgi:hypothetical protein